MEPNDLRNYLETLVNYLKDQRENPDSPKENWLLEMGEYYLKKTIACFERNATIPINKILY